MNSLCLLALYLNVDYIYSRKRYSMDDKQIIQTSNNLNKIKLLYIDSSKYDVHWHSTLHSHPFTEFFYVLKGKGHFQFQDSDTMEVKEDDLVIINPNILHTEISDKDEPLEYIVLGVDGIGFFTELEDDSGHSIHNYGEFKHEILFYLKSLHKEVAEREPYYELMISNLLSVLIMNVMRRTVFGLEIAPQDNKINKDCIFIENYLNVHYREYITLDTLADLTFMNKYYLSHIFKEHSGYSPIDYVLHKRIGEAEKLLTSTDLSVSQIANIVGFGSSSYFSQYFKKQNKISPSLYRENHHKQSQIE